MSHHLMLSNIQDITPHWLSNALKSQGVSGDVCISQIALKRVGSGSGFIGECVQIVPTYRYPSGQEPSSMIGKFPSSDNTVRAAMNAIGLYGREIRFYIQLAEKVCVNTPKIYYCTSGIDTTNHVLIMEDMSHAQNGDDLQGSTKENALFAIGELARMHADWWENTLISGFPGQMQTPAERQRNFKNIWPVCLERIEAELPDSFIKTSNLLTTQLGAITGALTERPQTLIHGDFRYDNMFFGQSHTGPQLTLIDWQMVERACATCDISYFVASSLDIVQRRDWEEILLESYHEKLMEYGVTDYGFTDLMNDYRLSFVRFVELWVEAGAHLNFDNPRRHAYFRESMARFDAIYKDHDLEEVIQRHKFT